METTNTSDTLIVLLLCAIIVYEFSLISLKISDPETVSQTFDVLFGFLNLTTFQHGYVPSN